MKHNTATTPSAFRRAASIVRARASAIGTGALVALGTSPVFAQDFDPAPIQTKITTYAGYAVAILAAMALAVWGLRAMGLVGGRK